MKEIVWHSPTTAEEAALTHLYSRTAARRGVSPCEVRVRRNAVNKVHMVAFKYVEPGKWDRWSISYTFGRINPGVEVEARIPQPEITGSWSVVLSWLRPLVGDRAVIEVYPRDAAIVNTAPFRWFWVVPHAFPHTPEFDLRAEVDES